MSATQTQQTSSTALSSSQAFSSSNKYGSLIEPSFSKQVKVSLFQFSTYLTESCPHALFLHSIVGVLRLFQLIGPALFIPFEFWSSGSISREILNIFSVFFHLIPYSYREAVAPVLSFLYAGFVLIFSISIIAAAKYFQKAAKIGKWASNTIYFLLNTLGYIFHPIAIESAGEMIGVIIKHPSHSHKGLYIVEMVVIAIAFIAFNVLLREMISTSVFCRPSSLFAVLGEPPRYFIMITAAITLTSSIASKCDGFIQDIFLCLTALLYVGNVFNTYLNGGFLAIWHVTFICSLSIAGFLFCIEYIVCSLLKISGSDLILIICIFEVVAISIGVYFFNSRRLLNHMKLIDDFEVSGNSLDHISSVRTFVNSSISGFYLAHPSVLNWEYFTVAIEKWPEAPHVWFVFTKFLAIYPEVNQLFMRIFQQLFSMKLHGAGTKRLITEIMSLQQHRETNMSPQMRRKINHVTKATWALKNKMRQVWDLVIQGNMSDIVPAIAASYDDTLKLEADYARLLRQFPNSRFVTRSYSRFIMDVYADHVRYSEWAEKTKNLQRGISINEDIAHELGLIYFPNIPSVIQTAQLSTLPDLTESSIMEEEADVNTGAEQLISMRSTMENLRIAGPANAFIIRICMFFITFVVPFLVLVIYVFSFEGKAIDPLTYMKNIASLRTFDLMTNAYGLKVLYTTLYRWSAAHPDACGKVIGWRPVADLLEPEGEGPPYLGGTWDEKEQFDYLRVHGTSTLELIDHIDIDLAVGDEDSIDSLLFESTIDYTIYTGSDPGAETKYNKLINLKSAFSQLILDLSTIDSIEVEYCPDYNNNPLRHVAIMNCLANCDLLANRCDALLSALMIYTSDLCIKYEKLFRYVMIALILAITVIQIVDSMIEIKMTESSRATINRCLMAMPKNVISRVSDPLKSVKKGQTEDSVTSETSMEVNKQEENILKVLITSSENSKLAGIFEFSMCTIFSIVFNAVMVILLCLIYNTVCVEVGNVAPHVNYLMGAFAYQSGAYTSVLLLSLLTEDNGLDFLSFETLYSHFDDRLARSTTYFDSARYGDESGRKPSEAFTEGLTEAVARLLCTEDHYIVPTSWEVIYQCLSPDLLFSTGEDILHALIEPVKQTNYEVQINWDDEVLEYFWDMEYEYIYDKLFAPITAELDTKVKEEISAKFGPYIAYSAIFLFLGLIVSIIMLSIIKRAENEMRFSLEMLLLCPPEALLQNQLLTNILAGRFETKTKDDTYHDDEYFKSIIQEMPDAIIVCSLDGIILEYNAAASRLFEDRIETAKGDTFQNFFGKPFFNAPDTIHPIIAKQPPQEVETTYKDNKNDTQHLKVSSKPFPDRIVFTVQNISQAVLYQRLINEERAKSDQMLASILPPSLVHRVQRGEKKISFAVQSATITFMDIVEFTPWCAANTAAMVMSTLNRLFKEWDAICASKPTMTKVKCIGDCYMAAGGVFMEVNQPSEHAREVCEFGIGAIRAVEKVDEELGLERRIRVGINTGGPLVGGVIGSGKPTFEIIGPTINMAQQMEHHGVPMQVHISRATYELVYGGSFKIKERGQVEIKQGNVVTYLINPAEQGGE